MSLKARILYDFEGDTENGELNISEGNIVTVLNQDIGDGWWEGQLENGEVGLFPETYCEMIGQPDGHAQVAHQQQYEDEDDDWDTTQQDGEWEESRQDEYGNQRPDSREQRSISPSQRSASFGRAGTVRKNINRFSPFVKTGTESFVLGSINPKTQPTADDSIMVVLTPEGLPKWEPNPDPYKIKIDEPTKKSKYKGIKTFTAYSVIPSSTGKPVSRRYKHYDWLHDRLVEKFTINCVPPLPDKQYYGRYGEEFVEKRREKLERWSNRIARHPVLSRSSVITHFFLCDDDGAQWKAGKRRAEKDDLVAGAFFTTIGLPSDVTLDVPAAEAEVEHFGVFLRTMKQSLSKMRVKFIDHCNQMSGPFMAEFHKMAGVINGLAQCFAMEDKDYARGLTDAMHFTAETYRDIGTLHADQPRNDMLPSLDVMKEYLGMIHTYPDMVQVHKGAVGKIGDCDKMKEEGRIDYTDATDITTRSETISAAIRAEIYHFQHERVIDFREMMKFYLNEQIQFYQDIVRRLSDSKARYEDGTDL